MEIFERIILPLLTLLLGTYGGYLFKSKSNKIKELEEAKQENYKSQSEKIDLGDKYIEHLINLEKTMNGGVGDISKSINEIKKDIISLKEKDKEMDSKFDSISNDLLRMQLFNAINRTPKDIKTIEYLHDKYTKSGGNSYVIDVYSRWKDKYNKQN